MYDKLPRSCRLDAVQSSCTALSIVKRGASWLSPTSTTLELFWTPHPTTTPSCRPAHRPPEAQPATEFFRYVWNVLSNDETIQIVAYIEVCMILMVAM
ncbi:hypothetical protein Zm00014a_000525 [Zea mays]|uniref:Uncharacterized protein n=2 Tax=Zea mays TaxID=4577 RepID=A0A3L6FFT2_MAIZE|nr:hypothetical protein Zm00014a_000525 [Zea mays]PWZ32062.1 hypothetical protein Zm00014a_000525 [Zea mays]